MLSPMTVLVVYCKGWMIFTLCVLQRLEDLYSMCIAKVGSSLLYVYCKGWRIFTLYVFQGLEDLYSICIAVIH